MSMEALQIASIIILIWILICILIAICNHRATRYRRWKLDELEKFDLGGTKKKKTQHHSPFNKK